MYPFIILNNILLDLFFRELNSCFWKKCAAAPPGRISAESGFSAFRTWKIFPAELIVCARQDPNLCKILQKRNSSFTRKRKLARVLLACHTWAAHGQCRAGRQPSESETKMPACRERIFRIPRRGSDHQSDWPPSRETLRKRNLAGRFPPFGREISGSEMRSPLPAPFVSLSEKTASYILKYISPVRFRFRFRRLWKGSRAEWSAAGWFTFRFRRGAVWSEMLSCIFFLMHQRLHALDPDSASGRPPG